MASRPDLVRHTPGRGVLAILLLAVPVVLPLLVWTYARVDPQLGGIPFFFWYQFALIPVSAVCTLAAYWLLVGSRQDQARQGQRRDGDAL